MKQTIKIAVMGGSGKAGKYLVSQLIHQGFPLIALKEERGKVMVSLEDCPGEKISATDLAHFLIAQLTDEVYIRKAPFIGNV